MKTRIVTLLSLFLMTLTHLYPDAKVGEFNIRSVRPLTDTQVDDVREFVAADAEAAEFAKAIAERARPFLGAEPDPIAVIHYEGLVNTDPRRIETVEHLREMDAAALLTRYWQVSGNSQAKATVMRFIEAWASTYLPTGNDVNENKFFPLFVAYSHFRDDFDAEARAMIDTWMTDIAERHAKRVEQATRFTNRFNKSVRMLTVIGMALDRPEWVELALDKAKLFVSESLRADGTSYDLEHRDSLGYHGSSLKPIIEIALLRGMEAGKELYYWENEDGGSVAKSVAYVLPYARGEKVHKEWVNTKVQLDRERAAAGLAYYQPGKPYDPKNARELMDLASGFQPELIPLVRELSEDSEARFPTWNSFLAAALE